MESYINFDFVLFENKNEKIVFSFIPAKSHMHSFNDKPAKDYYGVYKVYYCWNIKRFIKENEGWVEDRILFDMNCDECSAIYGLEESIDFVLKKKKLITRSSPGQPGSLWEIEYNNGYTFKNYKDDFESDDEAEYLELYKEEPWLIFTVFNNCSNLGYRFVLSVEKAKEFALFISQINKYMLDHSEPI